VSCARTSGRSGAAHRCFCGPRERARAAIARRRPTELSSSVSMIVSREESNRRRSRLGTAARVDVASVRASAARAPLRSRARVEKTPAPARRPRGAPRPRASASRSPPRVPASRARVFIRRRFARRDASTPAAFLHSAHASVRRAAPPSRPLRPSAMVERNPWYSRVKGPFPESYGCVGVKPDGGGSMRGRGTVGKMRVHHAVFNRDSGAFYTLVPIRPRTRGERRSLRTFPGASLRPPLAFNTPCPRRLSTPPDAFQLHPDAFQLHPDVRLYGMALRSRRATARRSTRRSWDTRRTKTSRC
jgi:hypothetical protein